MKPFIALVAVVTALLVASLARSTHAAEIPSWAPDQQPVPYCVNGSGIPIGSTGAPIMTADAFAAQVQKAFVVWTSIPGVHLKVTYQGFCDSDPTDRRDGVNTIGWFRLRGAAIGLLHPSYPAGPAFQNGRARMIEADIVIDTRYAQSFDKLSEYVDVVLPGLLVHEIGHFIGLEHNNNPCSIMFPTENGVTELCEVDRDAARAAYP
jgi:hypothetical protein